MVRIRLAATEDCRFIATCLRELAGSVLPYTISGCKGLENHIADLIRAYPRSETTYLLCTEDEALVGVSEWRSSDRQLHLNHIFIIPELRRQGAGSMLLREGIRSFDPSRKKKFSLDSFAQNARANEWYTSLGLRPTVTRSWRVSPIASSAQRPGGVYFQGLEQANRKHIRYDFSQFGVKIGDIGYEIGRIGSQYFRTTSSTFLEEPAGLKALGHLDPQRNLLSILAVTGERDMPGTEVARSIRLETTCARLSHGLSATTAVQIP